MKVIIAGSRFINDFDLFHTSLAIDEAAIAKGITITEVVSGKNPRGIDWAGEKWARINKIPLKPFPANWKRFGLGAGPIRNAEMAEYADALIAIWDGKSRGTLDMITKMRLLKKLVYVKVIK